MNFITKNNNLSTDLEIVIIDDDPVTSMLHQIKVGKRFSKPLHVFMDAREALIFMTEAGDRNFLVLLDIDMPAMDGWDFLSEWQKADADSAIKVIMLSCSISTADKQRSQTFPEVVRYFEKPLYNSHLEEMEKLMASFHAGQQ